MQGVPALYCLSESESIGSAIATHANLPLSPLEERRFESGEFKLRPLESARGRPAWVVQTLAASAAVPTAERLVRLLFLLFGLKDAGASSLTAVVPYLAYARKERRTQLRDPVNTRYVAQLLEVAGLSRLVALDVHNPAALDNAFRVPVDHLSAMPMFAQHFARRWSDAEMTVVSPDPGGIKRAQIFRELLQRELGRETDIAFIEKRRARGVLTTGALCGAVAGRHVVVIDDLCASGATLCHAAELGVRAGARRVDVAVTHTPTLDGLLAVMASPNIAHVAVTDSVGLPRETLAAIPGANGRLDVLSIAPLFGLAIRRILDGKPMAPLLERWPVEDR